MHHTTIPFGPQHPVLPEPIHLMLAMEDEVITGAVPALDFVHRGLEKLDIPVIVMSIDPCISCTER